MQDKFNQWAILDLFGHSRIAGKVTEQTIGGCAFVRVDVPAIHPIPEFTKLFGQSAIYSISIVDEETAIATANALKSSPLSTWSAKEMLQSMGITDLAKKELACHCLEDSDEDDTIDERALRL